MYTYIDAPNPSSMAFGRLLRPSNEETTATSVADLGSSVVGSGGSIEPPPLSNSKFFAIYTPPPIFYV